MISVEDVRSFKENWCDENRIITTLIKDHLLEYFISPILDVGSGLGDISYNALRDKKVICVDINYVSEDEYPLSVKHERLQIDFFSYVPECLINTIFISHSLQFLDHNLTKLNTKIDGLNAENIILVLNKNDDIMGTLLDWTLQNFDEANPEVRVSAFPRGYNLSQSIPFRARIECPTFAILAQQIAYMMAIELGNKKKSLVAFLKQHMGPPRFEFDQVIEVYQKMKNDNLDLLLSFIENKEVTEKLRLSKDRITKSFNELFAGYKLKAEDVLNEVVRVSDYTGIVKVENINFYSFCEHHFSPFFGSCSVFYEPNEIITGLGKIIRLVRDVHARRLQIQETMTKDIAEDLKRVIRAKGVLVTTKAKHLCTCSRGPSDDEAESSVVYGCGTLNEWRHQSVI